jgi:hypothetical protein
LNNYAITQENVSNEYKLTVTGHALYYFNSKCMRTSWSSIAFHGNIINTELKYGYQTSRTGRFRIPHSQDKKCYMLKHCPQPPEKLKIYVVG